MAQNIKKEVQKNKSISYTNKDFNSLRQELQNHMLTHFSDNIIDFSDSSLGGMLLDLGAYVGDVMTYYMDHQFNENSIENAVERKNVERLIRESGLEIPSASPSFVEVELSIVVNAELNSSGDYQPRTLDLPVIKKNSIFSSTSNIDFALLEDVDFSKKDDSGALLALIEIGLIRNNNPVNYILKRKGMTSSATSSSENFVIEDKLVPFRTITLSQGSVNEITSIIDSSGDRYYEVDALSQDTVYTYYDNSAYDLINVPFRMEIQHAPKRFIKNRSVNSGLTTIRFGSGDEQNFDEDIIPDPSEHAIKMFGDKETLPSIAIDPSSFLDTQTLGISPRNTTLVVNYTHGGGLVHNVSAGEVNSIKTLLTTFKTGTSISSEVNVRGSLTVSNPKRASGGEDEPTLDDLRNIAIFNRNAQNRIVTREDLIARIYSMPSSFGRVFRAAVADNPRNPRGAQIFLISRDSSSKLITTTDTIKKNLVTYLNRFRLVSDSIDVLDAAILNFAINYTVTIEKGFLGEIVLNSINSKLQKYVSIANTQIHKPLITGELQNLIQNTPGVVSVINMNVNSKSGTIDGNPYSPVSFKTADLLDRGFIFPPVGGIFELKYPNEDIVGSLL